MDAIFVSRHPGALEWARRRGITARSVAHLDPDDVAAGQTVIGTLPVDLAAAVCARGARYIHLSLRVRPEDRGRDLTADEMESCGAMLMELDIRVVAADWHG